MNDDVPPTIEQIFQPGFSTPWNAPLPFSFTNASVLTSAAQCGHRARILALQWHKD